MDSISSGYVVGVGQLEGGIGTGEVRALDNDKGSVSAVHWNWIILELATDCEVTHEIPTTE